MNTKQTLEEAQFERLDEQFEDMSDKQLERVIELAEDWRNFHGKEYYNADVNVHRDDVRHALNLDKDHNISDAQMDVIADKLGDALMNDYWISLEIIAEEVLNYPIKHNVDKL